LRDFTTGEYVTSLTSEECHWNLNYLLTKTSVRFDVIHCGEIHFTICKQVPSSLPSHFRRNVFPIDAIFFTDFLDDFYLPHESVDWHSTITESWISFQ